MNGLAAMMAIASGFALLAYNGPAVNVIATSIVVDLALAPLTATIAARRGRSWVAWGAIGLALGAWALVAVMLLPAIGPEDKATA